jgi:hypothetical protein
MSDECASPADGRSHPPLVARINPEFRKGAAPLISFRNSGAEI